MPPPRRSGTSITSPRATTRGRGRGRGRLGRSLRRDKGEGTREERLQPELEARSWELEAESQKKGRCSCPLPPALSRLANTDRESRTCEPRTVSYCFTSCARAAPPEFRVVCTL